MSSSFQNGAFGRPPQDLGVSSLASKIITTDLLAAIEVVDHNVAAIERDIYDIQNLTSNNATDLVSNAMDTIEVERTVMDLHTFHSTPWFSKLSFIYGRVIDSDWDHAGQVPSAGLEQFVRRVTLPHRFSSVMVVLPAIQANTRHCGLFTEPGTAVVHVTENPLEATRLTSFEFEWFPSDSREAGDIQVGHATLMSRPPFLSNFLFGSDIDSSLDSSRSVVFPECGPFYVQSLYVDNSVSTSTSQIVLIGQKYNVSDGTVPLPGFEYYGIQ